MAGRTTTLHRDLNSSGDEYQEHQPRSKTTRRVATLARPRMIRHRQAKLIPSVEAYNPTPESEPELEPIVSDSESDFKDLHTTLNSEKATQAKRQLPSRPGREIKIAGPSRMSLVECAAAKSRPDEESTDQASEFNPSEANNGSSETGDEGHSRKRSRLNAAQSSSRPNPSSTSGRQNERNSPGEGSSRDLRVLLPIAPTPYRRAEPTRGGMNRGGRSRLQGVRIERGPSQIPTSRPNSGGGVVSRHGPGEGSSRAVPCQEDNSVEYLHTLPRYNIRAGPPPEMAPLVDRTKKDMGTRVVSSNPVETSISAASQSEKHGSGEGFLRKFRTVVVQFRQPSGQDGERDGGFNFNLVDCRNERNGLDGPCSKGKQKAVDSSQKCRLCFKFRRNCDPAAGASCSACMGTKSQCVPRKPQRTREEVGLLLAQEFSGSKLWEKCRSCAALDKRCIFNEEEDDCQNCKKRGWKCQPQMAPKPKKRKEYQGRFQDVKLKCHFCVKSRAHCDGAKPK